jgi:TPR repeat protein
MAGSKWMVRIWWSLALALIVSRAQGSDEPHAVSRETSVEALKRGRALWQSDAVHPEIALPQYRRAAEQGVAEAQSFLGWAYLRGKGVARDPVAAAAWFELAAAQDDPYAVYMLALINDRGEGVPRDQERSRVLLARAANLYYPDAFLAFAGQAFRVRSDEATVARALAYLMEGVEQGDARAMLMLGRARYEGRGIQQDFSEAFKWLLKASRTKEGQHAGLWVAHCYAHGFGVKADLSQADKMFADLQKSLSMRAVNDFSWELAVSPVDSVRDGVRAVALMTAKLRDSNASNSAYLDTLAAAYAEAGDFTRAVATQELAIDALKAEPGRVARLSEQFKERRELYKNGKPYREQP